MALQLLTLPFCTFNMYTRPGFASIAFSKETLSTSWFVLIFFLFWKKGVIFAFNLYLERDIKCTELQNRNNPILGFQDLFCC